MCSVEYIRVITSIGPIRVLTYTCTCARTYIWMHGHRRKCSCTAVSTLVSTAVDLNRRGLVSLCHFNMHSSCLLLFVIIISNSLLESEGLRKLTHKCHHELKRCHGHGKYWQTDGVCKEQVCVAPDTLSMKIKIIVRYRSGLRSTRNKRKKVKDLFIRGVGPGLSWDKPVQLKKSAISIDTWQLHIKYFDNSDGMTCASSKHCSQNQRALEFRLYTSRSIGSDMKGPNFRINLPMSQSLTGAAGLRTFGATIYPWFHATVSTTKKFTTHILDIDDNNALKVECSVIYPPSFKENIRKKYPLVILLTSIEKEKLVKNLLEQLFVHEASVQESIVAIVSFPEHRMHPFSVTTEFTCVKPGCSEDCIKCWDSKRKVPCKPSLFEAELLNVHCITQKDNRGLGKVLLASIKNDIIPEIVFLSLQRVNVDFPLNRVTIIGHAEGAILACFAPIYYPEVYENAACLSPKFFLPVGLDGRDLSASAWFKSSVMNRTQYVKQHKSTRILHSTQKYYIDNGELENLFWPSENNLKITDEVVNLLKDGLDLEENKNIFRAIIPQTSLNYELRTYDIISRLRTPLTYFFRPLGGIPKYDLNAVLDASKSKRQKWKPPHLKALKNPESIDDSTFLTIDETEDCPIVECKYKDVPMALVIVAAGESCYTRYIYILNNKLVNWIYFLLAVSGVVSMFMSVVVMCLRESNRRAAIEADKEDEELMEDYYSSDD